MKTQTFPKLFACLSAFILTFHCSASVFGLEQENFLYKAELNSLDSKTIVITLFTKNKYLHIPTLFKKDDTDYVFFLSNTSLNLENEPKTDHLKEIIDNVKIEYFPGKSQNPGYIKFFIKTAQKELVLQVHNVTYTPIIKSTEKKTVQAKTEEPDNQQVIEFQEENNLKTEPLMQLRPRQAEVIEEQQQQQIPKDKKAAPAPQLVKVVEKVIVKDYSPGIYLSLIIISCFGILFFIKTRQKQIYDGKLSGKLKKLSANLAKDDYILLFTENENLISNLHKFCSVNKIHLIAATDKIEDLSNIHDVSDGFIFKILEFRFNEFFNHRDFYKKLNPKPKIIILNTDFKFISNEVLSDFNFVDVKNHIDLNYTNTFLIINLILNEYKNPDQTVIFTDSGKYKHGLNKNNLPAKILQSTHSAIRVFIEKIKNKKQNILYLLNDFPN